MKNYIKTGLILSAILTIGTGNLKAQNTAFDSKAYLSVGPEIGLPVGHMKDRYKWGFGASVQADVPLVEEVLFLTGNVGYANFYTKSDIAPQIRDLHLLPVKAGLKLFAADNLYLQASLGPSFLLNKKDAGYDKGTAFVYAPQIGYQFKAGKRDILDAGVNFQGNSKFIKGGSANNLFGFRVAYGFGL